MSTINISLTMKAASVEALMDFYEVLQDMIKTEKYCALDMIRIDIHEADIQKCFQSEASQSEVTSIPVFQGGQDEK